MSTLVEEGIDHVSRNGPYFSMKILVQGTKILAGDSSVCNSS